MDDFLAEVSQSQDFDAECGDDLMESVEQLDAFESQNAGDDRNFGKGKGSGRKGKPVLDKEVVLLLVCSLSVRFDWSSTQLDSTRLRVRFVYSHLKLAPKRLASTEPRNGLR